MGTGRGVHGLGLPHVDADFLAALAHSRIDYPNDNYSLVPEMGRTMCAMTNKIIAGEEKACGQDED